VKSMSILKYAGLALILPILACGSNGGDGNGKNGDQKESESVQAVLIKYQIEVDNIPLVGPQSEAVELTISDRAVKYIGLAEISVGDEIKKIRHFSILDFSDTSQTFINSADSTYSVNFLKFPDAEEASSEKEENIPSKSGYLINMTSADETKNIGPLAGCRKFNVRSAKGAGLTKSDSIPSLRGEIWIYGGDDVSDMILNYYKTQARFFRDQSFEGLGLWGVLGRLGIPRQGLIGFMDQLSGFVAKADLNVELYSLGKKANISIKADISDFERKRLPGTYFAAPPEYKPVYGREGVAKAVPANK
jgi:hypothetical protein